MDFTGNGKVKVSVDDIVKSERWQESLRAVRRIANQEQPMNESAVLPTMECIQINGHTYVEEIDVRKVVSAVLATNVKRNERIAELEAEVERQKSAFSDSVSKAEAARRFADYAAEKMVEQLCTAKKKRGEWEYGICGPLVSPAFDYLKSCGRIEFIGNGRVRITEAPK